MTLECDYLIRSIRLFDGSGGSVRSADVAIESGHVKAVGAALSADGAKRVINADGLWLIPGLLDIHTHFDLEVELAPGLPEAVRHGTTTVVVANCSIGLAFGNQRKNNDDPIVDCFARVENVPKTVLKLVADRATWSDSGDYLKHLDSLPLGPNIVPLVPHSMLRIEAMGLEASISRDPTESELHRMEQLLEKAMDEGYAGFSTDALPFHYLANHPNEKSRIPSQYVKHRELKRLLAIIRNKDRLWQATPPKDKPLEVLQTFLLSSGRFYGKPLKLTAVAALDFASNKSLVTLAKVLSLLLNNPLVNGRLRMQALAAPFKVWADGPFTPLAEEIPVLRLLNETDLEDRDARLEILHDPAYRAKFKAMWSKGKHGISLARLKRLLKREDFTISRDLADMVIESCPVAVWAGEDMASLYARLMAYREDPRQARSEEERATFMAMDKVTDDADFILHLLECFDTDLYWYTTSANRDPRVIRKLLMNPHFLPGFNDSGAHLTNMAFYDGNLRALQVAQKQDLASVSLMVRRLTDEPAQFFGIDAGRIRPGARADLVLIDPEALASYDSAAHNQVIDRDVFSHRQRVNRSDGVVPLVMINGKIAWEDNAFTPEFGKAQGFGRCLRAKDHEDALHTA